MSKLTDIINKYTKPLKKATVLASAIAAPYFASAQNASDFDKWKPVVAQEMMNEKILDKNNMAMEYVEVNVEDGKAIATYHVRYLVELDTNLKTSLDHDFKNIFELTGTTNGHEYFIKQVPLKITDDHSVVGGDVANKTSTALAAKCGNCENKSFNIDSITDVTGSKNGLYFLIAGTIPGDTAVVLPGTNYDGVEGDTITLDYRITDDQNKKSKNVVTSYAYIGARGLTVPNLANSGAVGPFIGYQSKSGLRADVGFLLSDEQVQSKKSTLVQGPDTVGPIASTFTDNETTVVSRPVHFTPSIGYAFNDKWAVNVGGLFSYQVTSGSNVTTQTDVFTTTGDTLATNIAGSPTQFADQRSLEFTGFNTILTYQGDNFNVNFGPVFYKGIEKNNFQTGIQGSIAYKLTGGNKK